MKFIHHKTVIVLSSLVLLVILLVVIISSFWPEYEEQFIELGLLGEDKTADNYFPNGNYSLSEGSQLNWFIYVYNHMSTPQRLYIKVKLINSTIYLPDDHTHKPSPAETIVDIPLLLDSNDTSIIPFSWRLNKIDYSNQLVYVKSLIVNDQLIELQNFSSSDSDYRIVFELWTHNELTNEYLFSWRKEAETFSVSLHMGFKVISR